MLKKEGLVLKQTVLIGFETKILLSK